jgi:hypothetical protein
MDEQSALLLAQHYSEYWPIYAYFSDLPGIDATTLHDLFSLMDQIKQKPPLNMNLEMGQLNSLLELICILSRRHVITDEEAAKLLSETVHGLQGARDEADASLSSVNALKAIVATCRVRPEDSWDVALRNCLLGTLNPDDFRVRDYQLVLEAQKAPTLEGISRIVKGVEEIQKHPDSVRESSSQVDLIASLKSEAASIAKAASDLPSAQLPKHSAVKGREKDAILLYDPTDVQKRATELTAIAGKQKPNPKAAKKAASDLMREMEPQVTAALAGSVYAYFLRSTDLVVSEDPLLMRNIGMWII